MAYYRKERVIPVIVMIIIITIVVAIAVSVARVLFFPEKTNTPNYPGRESLLNTSVDRSVVMSVRGPITAEESFRSYDISVASNARNLTVYKGYTGNIERNISLANSVVAYEQFVYALDEAGLVKSNSTDDSDLKGICASGYIYEFKIKKSSDIERRLWTSTCSSAHGSLSTKLEKVKRLFLVQIPGSDGIIRNIW